MNTPLKVQVVKLIGHAKLPEYATDGSGCFDIYSSESLSVSTVQSFETLVVPTGLAFEVPEGHVMLVYSRSGMGFKHNVRLANCVAVIDSDYRGELLIKLTNDNSHGQFTFAPGQAIAQGMIVPIPKVEFLETQELSETVRGEGGFGSTDRVFDFNDEKDLVPEAPTPNPIEAHWGLTKEQMISGDGND